MVGTIDCPGTGGAPVQREEMEQHFVRRRTAAAGESCGICCGAEGRRVNLRAGFFLGSFRVHSNDHRAAAMAAHAVYRHAGLRLFLQHGIHELLFVAGARLFWVGDFLAREGNYLERRRPGGRCTDVVGASHRFFVVGRHAGLHKGSRENASVVEIGAAAGSGERVCGDLQVHVASAFAIRRLGSRTVLSLQRCGPAGALWKALLLSCWSRFLVRTNLRGGGSLWEAARGLFLETIRSAVRIICGDVLREGAASGKSAGFTPWRLDWIARFKAYDDLRHFGALLAGTCEATKMASFRLQHLRGGILRVSLSGHGMAEPAGGQRGKVSK